MKPGGGERRISGERATGWAEVDGSVGSAPPCPPFLGATVLPAPTRTAGGVLPGQPDDSTFDLKKFDGSPVYEEAHSEARLPVITARSVSPQPEPEEPRRAKFLRTAWLPFIEELRNELRKIEAKARAGVAPAARMYVRVRLVVWSTSWLFEDAGSILF